MTTYTAADALFGHMSEDTALVVDDYPYGFRLRTTIRYWIETTKNGDRFVSQTMNPKTGRWNKPKKSTYSEVMVMVRDPETGYISHTAVNTYDSLEWIEKFRAIVGDNLTDAQKASLALVLAMHKVFSKVTWEIKEGQPTDEDVARGDENMKRVAAAVDMETRKFFEELVKG